MNVIVLSKRKIKYAVCFVVGFILLMVTLSHTGAYAVFYGGVERKLPIYSVDKSEKVLSISFDCAWGTDYTDELLSIMKDEDVKCTFFMVEFWVKKHPDYVKKISDYGHEIGTHSSTHPYMSKLDEQGIKNELISSAKSIVEITGKKVDLFRPPYGDYDNLLIETASALGLYTIQWDVDSLDWKNLSGEEITLRVVKRVKNGSIVLFHNQGLNTAKALRGIIKELKSMGYSFVPIGELIYKDNYRIDVTGRQIPI